MEDDLILRARGGDPAAFRTLVEQFTPGAWRVACILVPDRAQAEDALQEAWVDVWRGLSRFDTSRPFRPWFLTVVGNRCRMFARQRQRSTQALDAATADELPDPHDDFAAIDALQSGTALARALVALSAEERELLALRYQADLELAEIAALYGVPLSTVESRLYRLLAALRTRLSSSTSTVDSAETIA